MGAKASGVFSMSVFEALRQLRMFRGAFPALLDNELIHLISKLEISGLDYASAIILDELVPSLSNVDDPIEFLRACIEAAVSQNRIWFRTITLGRQKFLQKLGRDEVSCFRCANLLTDPITDDVLNWWDRMQSKGRAISEDIMSDQGRRAEKLSLEFEESRLKKLGIAEQPTWMAIEDNTVGYDILSYDIGSSQPVSRLIEVKSFIGVPRFFISRNEWIAAKKYSRSYIFHIWDMNLAKLYERTVEEVELQIPKDSNEGQWQNAIVLVFSAA